MLVTSPSQIWTSLVFLRTREWQEWRHHWRIRASSVRRGVRGWVGGEVVRGMVGGVEVMGLVVGGVEVEVEEGWGEWVLLVVELLAVVVPFVKPRRADGCGVWPLPLSCGCVVVVLE